MGKRLRKCCLRNEAMSVGADRWQDLAYESQNRWEILPGDQRGFLESIFSLYKSFFFMRRCFYKRTTLFMW